VRLACAWQLVGDLPLLGDCELRDETLGVLIGERTGASTWTNALAVLPLLGVMLIKTSLEAGHEHVCSGGGACVLISPVFDVFIAAVHQIPSQPGRAGPGPSAAARVRASRRPSRRPGQASSR
jgi:hypothetical protein